jgi:hypothetical protein
MRIESKPGILPGFCGCGCGQETKISNVSNSLYGWTKGEPRRFLAGHCNRNTSLETASRWNGGTTITPQGYKLIMVKGHPRGGSRGYVFEHILIVEKALGKYLPPKAVVHHPDERRAENSGPLVICQDNAYHRLLHRRMAALKACGNADWLKCWICKTYDDPQNLIVKTGNPYTNYHEKCMKEYQRRRRKSAVYI